MATLPGDIWRLAMRLRNTAADPEAVGLCTFWLQAVSTYSGPQDLATAFQEAFHPIILSLPVSVHVDGYYLRQFYPSMGPTFEWPLTSEQGSLTALPLPTDNAVEVLRKGIYPSRINWGRFYLPFAPIAWVDTSFTNRLDPTAISALLSRLNNYRSTMLGPNSSGTSWLDGIWSYRSQEFNPQFATTDHYVVWPMWRSVGRRARRQQAIPPFPSQTVPMYAIGTFGNGRRDIWFPPHSGDGRDLMMLTHWNSAWSTYPTPPTGWTTAGSSTTGWDNITCRLSHSILDSNAGGSHGYGWEWPVNGGGGGPDDFPYAVPQYTSRTNPTTCGAGANPGGHFDDTLWVRDFDLPDSPIFAAQVRLQAEQGAELYVNGFLAAVAVTTGALPEHSAVSINADIAGYLVTNATNRIAVVQHNNNNDALHNPALWNVYPPGPIFYNDYPFLAFEANIIQYPI